MENSKKYEVTECPLYANQECILKRISELQASKKLFSVKSETDDGCLVAPIFLRDHQKNWISIEQVGPTWDRALEKQVIR